MVEGETTEKKWWESEFLERVDFLFIQSGTVELFKHECLHMTNTSQRAR